MVTSLNFLMRAAAAACLCATAFAANAQVQHTLSEREGLQVYVGVENWDWEETQEDGSGYVGEAGSGVTRLGLSYTFSVYDPQVLHSIGVEGSAGTVTYDGSYIGGGAVTSTTRWDALRLNYDRVAPLPGTSWDWLAGVSFEKRNRAIWNPSAKRDQKEDFLGGIARLGVQSQRPSQTGWFGGAGMNLTFSTNEDTYAKELGLKEDVTLSPGSSLGYQWHVGYAFSRNTSLELHQEMLRWKISNKVNVSNAAGDTGQIWQPASDLTRTSLRLTHKF